MDDLQKCWIAIFKSLEGQYCTATSDKHKVAEKGSNIHANKQLN